jgi:hypothetical protein
MKLLVLDESAKIAAHRTAFKIAENGGLLKQPFVDLEKGISDNMKIHLLDKIERSFVVLFVEELNKELHDNELPYTFSSESVSFNSGIIYGFSEERYSEHQWLEKGVSTKGDVKVFYDADFKFRFYNYSLNDYMDILSLVYDAIYPAITDCSSETCRVKKLHQLTGDNRRFVIGYEQACEAWRQADTSDTDAKTYLICIKDTSRVMPRKMQLKNYELESPVYNFLLKLD